jgi:hypothetical protein
MTTPSEREAYDRRQAAQRLTQWEGAVGPLAAAEFAIECARTVAMGEWSEMDLIAFDDIKSMLMDLRETAEAGVREQMELLSESPIISEKDI